MITLCRTFLAAIGQSGASLPLLAPIVGAGWAGEELDVIGTTGSNKFPTPVSNIFSAHLPHKTFERRRTSPS